MDVGQPEEPDWRGEVGGSHGTTADGAERFELYKLAVEMADRVSARRGTANAFFLTLNTALVGLAGLSGSATPNAGLVSIAGFRIPILAVTGLVIAAAWWLLLRSYRDLNEAKFKVINAIEEDLAAHPFRDEWRYLKEDPVKPLRSRYAELSVLERAVPVAFATLYIVLWAGSL